MKDITHIERSNLPWRTENATECGLDADRHPTWTRDEVQAKQKELGKQRLSLFVCMTCWGTYTRHATWEEDPASCMARHCSGMGLSRWGRLLSSDHPERRRFADELRAIALLVENHRDEFDTLVGELQEVVDLSASRRSKRGSRS